MRKTQIATFLVCISVARVSGAEEACPYKAPEPARIWLEDRTIIYEQMYHAEWGRCARAAGGEGEVRFFSGKSKTPLRTEKIRLSSSRGTEVRSFQAKLFPSNYCKEKTAPKGAKKRLVGVGRKERMAYVVPIRAKVVATGAMAPLAHTTAVIEATCTTCSKGAGYGRLTLASQVTWEATPDKAWFQCVRKGATLELLFFTGDSRKDVVNAIRPDFVLKGIERTARPKKDKMVMKKSFPLAKLCAGKKKYLSYEVWGRGALKSIGGGGRSIYPLKCK